MAALPDLVTVAQFRQLPERGEFAYELHHGEVVAVTRPRSGHVELQHHVMGLLGPKLVSFGVVRVEYPYRPVAEFDLRVADVAVISRERWESVEPEDNLHGAPELVVEVKSPSNTKAQLRDLVSICLANGALQCWVLDSLSKSVTVYRRDGSRETFACGSRISLEAFGSDHLSVSEIFA